MRLPQSWLDVEMPLVVLLYVGQQRGGQDVSSSGSSPGVQVPKTQPAYALNACRVIGDETGAREARRSLSCVDQPKTSRAGAIEYPNRAQMHRMALLHPHAMVKTSSMVRPMEARGFGRPMGPSRISLTCRLSHIKGLPDCPVPLSDQSSSARLLPAWALQCSPSPVPDCNLTYNLPLSERVLSYNTLSLLARPRVDIWNRLCFYSQ